MNKKTLVSVHGYKGDRHQIETFLPLYEHHKCPVVIVSPSDSAIVKMGKHICINAGKRAYVGQLSWDREWEQIKLLLQYPEFDWFLMNDSDSFVMCPELPDYLYEDENVLWSNLVDDFRVPGTTFQNIPIPLDYHKEDGMLKAAQPPYFCHRKVLEKIVKVGPGKACPITPFIDYQLVRLPLAAGVELRNFKDCVSCESKSPNGMNHIRKSIKRGANFIHSIKTHSGMKVCVSAYTERERSQRSAFA